MRCCAMLMAAVLLASCSVSRDYSSANRVTLQFGDSSLKECYLLAVRDEALIVSTVDPAGLGNEDVLEHTMILPMRSVDRVYKENVRTFSGTYLPTIADIFTSKRAFRMNAFGNNLSAIYDAARFTYEYLNSRPFSEFELSNDRDVEMLRTSVAEYPSTQTGRLPIK